MNDFFFDKYKIINICSLFLWAISERRGGSGVRLFEVCHNIVLFISAEETDIKYLLTGAAQCIKWLQ